MYRCDYGLVLTDLKMPIMDGYEMIERMFDVFDLYGIEKQRQPQIVCLTGHVESEYIQRAFECGADQLIGKPCRINQVLMVLIANGYEIEIEDKLRRMIRNRQIDEI